MNANPLRPAGAFALAILVSLNAGGALAAAPDSPPGRPDRTEARIDRMTQELGLDADQQQKMRGILQDERTQIQRIRADARKRVRALLTAEQQAKLDAAMQRRADRMLDRLSQRLGLSPEQKDKIGAIFTDRRNNPELSKEVIHERIAAVLTPEQIQRFDEMRQRHGRGSKGPGWGPGPGNGPGRPDSSTSPPPPGGAGPNL